MKLCMMSYTMARRPELFTVRGMLELAQEIGLTGIDFVTLHDTPAKDLRALASDYGLTVACHTFFADLSRPTPTERQEGVETIKRGVEAAVALGTDKVMIPTPGREDQPREETRRNIIAGLQEVADFAAQAGITLTVENFPGARSPFVIADDMLQLVRAVPGVKVTYDNGNVYTGGENPADSFAQVAGQVIHAHFKDWHITESEQGMHGLDGRWYRGGLIGEGIVDQRSCLAAMKQAGYRGFIDIEYEGNDYTPAEATRKAVAYLNGILQELAL